MAGTAKKSEKDSPRRLRWSVPRADVSSNDWLDMQEDISVSLRLLIRESIERNGFVDVMNRPVEQLPRRGRPPQNQSYDDAVGADDGGDEGYQGSTSSTEQVGSTSTESALEQSSDQRTAPAAGETDEAAAAVLAPETTAKPAKTEEPAAETKKTTQSAQPEQLEQPETAKSEAASGISASMGSFLTS